MIHDNLESIWRNLALGMLLASTITLLACGAARTMPGGSMPGGTTPGGGTGGTMPGGGMGQHPMSHPRPRP